MKNRTYVLIAAACGAAIGGSVTYLITAKKIAEHFQLVADEEIISVKNTYARMYKRDGFETATEAAETLGVDEADVSENDELSDELGYSGAVSKEDLEDAGHLATGHIPAERVRPVTQKTLYNRISEDQVMARLNGTDEKEAEPVEEVQPGAIEITQVEPQEFDPTIPYTITYEEYYEDFKGHDKKTITYYEGDDTLTDERDRPIDDIERVIGRESLNYFGVRSKDKNIVHVRNERLEIDYEIVKDERDYLEVVVGVKNIWDENDKQKNRKMRDDD